MKKPMHFARPPNLIPFGRQAPNNVPFIPHPTEKRDPYRNRDDSSDIVCQNLEKYREQACPIFKCLKGLRGLKGNSASPTDTWILDFKAGTMYGKQPLNKAFMKWWITPRTVTGVGKELMLLFQGLDYETKVYSDVVRPLIDDKICPNFVRFLASGNGCNYSEMENMLTLGATPMVYHDVAMRRLARNLTFIRFGDQAPVIRNKTVKRPDINNAAKVDFSQKIMKSVAENMVGKWGYNILINEAVDAQTFDEFEDANKSNLREFWPVVFQVIVGCYAMSLSRMTHNDIHTGNVWVEKRSSMAPLAYRIDGKVYVLNTRYMAKIYDFDRSYVKRLGNNPLCGSKDAIYSNQTNEFISIKDMVKFWKYFDSKSVYSRVLREIIAPTETAKIQLNKITDYFLGPGKTKRASDFTMYSRPGKIVEELGKYLVREGYLGGGGVPTGSEVYRMDASMFSTDGILLKSSPGAVASVNIPELLMITRGTLANIRDRMGSSVKLVLANQDLKKKNLAAYNKMKALAEGMAYLLPKVTKQAAVVERGNHNTEVVTVLNYDSSRLSALGKEFDAALRIIYGR